MEIYQITERGISISRDFRAARTPAMKVLDILRSHRMATKEKILDYVPDANGHTLRKLIRKGCIIRVGSRVEL